jgi:NAD(P)-dependent dehydrogenase (short-subunit alcohol dehydrogenase family)
MPASQRRVALVTGGARRIGAAIVRALAQDGWHVLIHHHDSQAQACALSRELRAAGHACDPIGADLGRADDIGSLIPRAIEIAGPLDCLINNAARFQFDDIHSVGWDSLHGHMVPNLVAPLLLSRAFSEQFGERSGGCIVNLLDQKVGNLNPDFLSYTLSKVALAGLTEMLAMAFAGRIRVCGISPGLTLISGRQTEASFRRAWTATPLGRSSTPEEIAVCVRFVLATTSLTGQTITLDGGESLRGRARDVAFDPSV